MVGGEDGTRFAADVEAFIASSRLSRQDMRDLYLRLLPNLSANPQLVSRIRSGQLTAAVVCRLSNKELADERVQRERAEEGRRQLRDVIVAPEVLLVKQTKQGLEYVSLAGQRVTQARDMFAPSKPATAQAAQQAAAQEAKDGDAEHDDAWDGAGEAETRPSRSRGGSRRFSLSDSPPFSPRSGSERPSAQDGTQEAGEQLTVTEEEMEAKYSAYDDFDAEGKAEEATAEQGREEEGPTGRRRRRTAAGVSPPPAATDGDDEPVMLETKKRRLDGQRREGGAAEGRVEVDVAEPEQAATIASPPLSARRSGREEAIVIDGASALPVIDLFSQPPSPPPPASPAPMPAPAPAASQPQQTSALPMPTASSHLPSSPPSHPVASANAAASSASISPSASLLAASPSAASVAPQSPPSPPRSPLSPPQSSGVVSSSFQSLKNSLSALSFFEPQLRQARQWAGSLRFDHHQALIPFTARLYGVSGQSESHDAVQALSNLPPVVSVEAKEKVHNLDSLMHEIALSNLSGAADTAHSAASCAAAALTAAVLLLSLPLRARACLQSHGSSVPADSELRRGAAAAGGLLRVPQREAAGGRERLPRGQGRPLLPLRPAECGQQVEHGAACGGRAGLIQRAAAPEGAARLLLHRHLHRQEERRADSGGGHRRRRRTQCQLEEEEGQGDAQGARGLSG